MRCEFLSCRPGQVVCRNCGLRVRSEQPPERVFASCSVQRTAGGVLVGKPRLDVSQLAALRRH